MDIGAAGDADIGGVVGSGGGMQMSVSYHHHHHHHQMELSHTTNTTNNNNSNNNSSPKGLLDHGNGGAAVANDMNIVKRGGGVKYKECLKNHAASIGGHANDGCGEFMASGEEGSLEALKCAACGCHRNFHRRESPSSSANPYCYFCGPPGKRLGAPPPSAHQLALPAPSQARMMMAGSYNHEGNSGAVDHMHAGSMYVPAMKKRFRTKFTQEQKEKMCAFAEKLGWRIQKHDDLAVQQFCMEVGVKRHVLKVWMHNNKHTLSKKPS
eukprot:TRINITY_DN8879_c0_g1_i1.p1 TRINITY_DN8879_c0_g1~~TRINITY_DN8879_c0_g1_i1.p1  ORF type:complete len:267 (+),score=5.47 TRINITY_DN8879_c0_g1_i1:736-1536(+)